MTIYAYHTPTVASPINDRRAGTIRVGSDNPTPVRITRDWDAVLYFAFRQHNQRPFPITGSTITARIFNTENTQVWSGGFVEDPLTTGAASLVINSVATGALKAGLYSMVIEYTDVLGRTMLAQSMNSLPRHVVEVIDFNTVSLNN